MQNVTDELDLQATDESQMPLAIDLDHAVLKTRALDEMCLEVVRSKPALLWKLLAKFFEGRAAVTGWFSSRRPLNAKDWPVKEAFVAYVKSQAATGREIVLVTSAHRSVAEVIVSRFPFISEIIVCDETSSQDGQEKARLLRSRFPDGFVFAGSKQEDLAVWRESVGGILVDANEKVAKRLRGSGKPVTDFSRPQNTIATLLLSLRPHQWAKNAIIFVPLILGGKAGDLTAWWQALIGFFALSLTASATYIVNDLWDLPNDRKHWSKRLRSIASGNLSIRGAVLLAVFLLASGFGLVSTSGFEPFVVLLAYLVLTLSYTFVWKRLPIVDVVVLASLFTVRLLLGIVLTDVLLSPWLLVFSMFVFLSLSVAKRHTEVLRLAQHGIERLPGRGYMAADAPLTLSIGLASAHGAVLIMIVYLIEDAFSRDSYASPIYLWAIPLFLFLFLGRIWLVSHRGELHDDPVAFALSDRASLLLGFCMGVSLLIALIGLG
ncbi:MAG: UbiA family prenyltransferase [Hyphomicrobiales bacterium]